MTCACACAGLYGCTGCQKPCTATCIGLCSSLSRSLTVSFFCFVILVLPEQPLILDRWGRQLNGTQLGPKQEGDDIVITCRVVGGK